MPGPGELPSQQPARIIGREAGLARLRGLVDPVPRASQVLLVTGEAGMGKTVLLADADLSWFYQLPLLDLTAAERQREESYRGERGLRFPLTTLPE